MGNDFFLSFQMSVEYILSCSSSSRLVKLFAKAGMRKKIMHTSISVIFLTNSLDVVRLVSLLAAHELRELKRGGDMF